MINVEKLIEWLGVEGAIAGLDGSDLTISELLEACQRESPPHSKMKRRDVVKWIVEEVRSLQTKGPDELMAMDADSLRDYFISIRASRDEILGLLAALDIRPGSVARRNLTEFAAREISDIGMYRRVARGGKSP
ncbi:hypothetical protein ACFPPA_10520 [Rhodanobacter ginsengisoli]|uniref:Rho termination factor N-terminal domain-containing protein n=1 Tax=Rhodanobacter ginsengisoli TaxID=418646 RepID=A0ABW0QMI3_9GAMM